MPTPDSHLGPNALNTGQAAREYGGTAGGAALPLGKKRIKLRYWLGAIAVSAAIWVGIAMAFGLV